MNTNEIAALVKTARKEQKLTQTELAGVAGTGLRFIVNLEQGKKSCQIQKVLDVLKALGIRIKLDSGKCRTI